jgi:hypothetical protein
MHRFRCTPKLARRGADAEERNVGRITARRGAKSCYPGKRIVAGLGRAMMFIVLWLTEACRNYFRS